MITIITIIIIIIITIIIIIDIETLYMQLPQTATAAAHLSLFIS